MLYKRILNHGKRVLSTILVASMAVIPVASAKLAEVGGPVSGAFMEAASADDDEPPLLPQGAEDLLILEENTIDRHMEQIPGVEDDEEDQESLEKLNKRNERKEEFALFILGSEHEASKELAKPWPWIHSCKKKTGLKKKRPKPGNGRFRRKKKKPQPGRKSARPKRPGLKPGRRNWLKKPPTRLIPAAARPPAGSS